MNFHFFKLEGLRRLRDRITMAGVDVLSVSSVEKSQLLLKRIEREASHRFDKFFTFISCKFQLRLIY